MFKSFDKYILKEIASPFAIGLLIYTFTLLINMIFYLSGTLIAKEASMLTVMEILLYMLPEFLAFTIPMSTLMGILAGLSRMSTDSEVVAFRTMGVNNSRILKPVMIFAIVNWIFASWLIMYMAPEASYRLTRLLGEVVAKRTISEIKPRNFYTKLPYYTLYFNDVDPNTGEWKDVFLYSRKKANKDDIVILADYGTFVRRVDVKDDSPGGKEKGSYIVLRNAQVHSYERKKPEEGYKLTSYSHLEEKVPDRDNIEQSRKARQFIFPELVRRMKNKPNDMALAIEYHKKFSQPFACLILGFLALSLGISTKKGGKVSGFIISLGIIFFYYTTSITAENMVNKGIISPFLGMWAANFLLLVLGVFLYYFSSKEKSINWERLLSFARRFKQRFRGDREPGNGKVVVVFKLPRLPFRLFKIIDIYVVKKLLFSFFLIFTSLILVFYIIDIVERIDDVVENKVAFHYLLEYVYHNTPEIISFVLPVSILTTVLLTFSVMSKNNEIVAVQVSGISLYRLTLPAIFIGLLLSGASFYVQENIMPDANKRKREVLNIIHKKKSKTEQELQQNWVVGANDTFYFYDYMDRKTDKILKFNILEMNDDFTFKRRVHAGSARWVGPQELKLEMGFERNFRNNEPGNIRTFTAKQVKIPGGRELFTKRIAFPEYMNIKTLDSYIAYLEEKNSDTRKYRARKFYKYAFPLASLMMVLIAIPFSFIMGNKGTLFGIGIAIGISMIFWFVFAVSSALGTAGILSPFISAFAPIFLFMSISFYLFMNIKT
ncbi:MAG: YjgP/YjgQ family permease [bacterium]|nr:YjgP/YjgQ family permease [bacterium]